MLLDWSANLGSNQGPLAYKASPLPTEVLAVRVTLDYLQIPEPTKTGVCRKQDYF